MLQKLQRSGIYGQMIKEYMELKRVDEFQARDLIDRQFGELDSFIHLEYERDMDYIDKRINTYYNLYSTRIAMVLGNGTNLEEMLNRLLLLLKEAEPEERERILGEIAQTHRLLEIGYIGRKSFERRRKRKPNAPTAILTQAELSEEDRQRLTHELLHERPDRYSMERVQEFFERLPVSEDGLPVEAFGLRTRDDAMMAASGIIYSGTVGFPYEVEFEEGMAETESASIRRFRIRKAKEGNL